MKAVVAAFNQEKALVGAFSVITNLRMELFQALVQDLELATSLLLTDLQQTEAAVLRAQIRRSEVVTIFTSSQPACK